MAIYLSGIAESGGSGGLGDGADEVGFHGGFKGKSAPTALPHRVHHLTYAHTIVYII